MPMNTVTDEQVAEILSKSEKTVQHRVFGKCTLITVKLPNGFVLTESTGCVDPANYDEKIGEQECMTRIAHRVWELEAYVLASRLAGIDPEREARLAARREKRRQAKAERIERMAQPSAGVQI